jgi:hypothetical protein
MSDLNNVTAKTITEIVAAIRDISPKIWETVLRQQYVEAYVSAFWAVVFGISLLFYYKAGKYLVVKNKDQQHWVWDLSSETYCILWFGLIVLVIISSIIFCVNVNDSVLKLLNPEFGAIEQIMKMVAGS